MSEDKSKQKGSPSKAADEAAKAAASKAADEAAKAAAAKAQSFFVKEGAALTSQRGILTKSTGPVTPLDFKGGEKVFNDLSSKGYLVKG